MSQRRVGAEVAVFGDSAGGQEMDHAGKELERSAKLLHRPVARAHDQAREIGIMQSQVVFYVDMQGKGKSPLPLHSIPKTNNNSKTKSNNKTKTKNKIKVVYTEDLTHPRDLPELLSFFTFPRHLWRKLRTTNVIERCFVEVRRRTRPMVCFVNVQSVDRIIYSIFQRFNLEWKTRTLNLFTQAA